MLNTDNKTTLKSTSRFLIKIDNLPTSWFSKLQYCVSTSTAEAEYYSLRYNSMKLLKIIKI